MNRYLQEGDLIERYLSNIEQQNQILMNLLETINRQNLSTRNLINSYINPFAPRYRDTNFNRNWNNTLSVFPTSTSRVRGTRNRESGLFSNRFSNRNNYQRPSGTISNNRNRARRTRLRSQNTQTGTNTQTETNTQTATNAQPNIFLQTILSMLSPVRISPSQNQIDNAVELYSYNSNEPRNCPIDREPIRRGDRVARIRHCGHIFRRASILTWFEHNPRCPLCRYDIRNYTRNDVSNNSTPVPPPSPPPPLDRENAREISPLSSSTQPLPSSPLPPPPSVPAPTHNAVTQLMTDLSFNDLANLFNNNNTTNVDEFTENFFSNLIQNMPLTELNNLSSINLDISGNTASLSFEGSIPPPPSDVD